MRSNVRSSSISRPVVLLVAVSMSVSISVASLALSGRHSEAQLADSSATTPLAIPGISQSADNFDDIDSEVVVVLDETASLSIESASNNLVAGGGELVDEDAASPQIKTVKFDELAGDEAAITAKAEELSELPGVKFAEPNSFVRMNYTPSDTYMSRPRGTANQGNFSLVGLPQAWNFSKGENTAVGIADTGVVPGYTEIPASKILTQTDKLNNDGIANDTFGHGSEMASLAAAQTNNRFGMAGAGFHTKVAMCKFAGYDPNTGLVGGSAGDLARCIDWLQKIQRVKVINLSLMLMPGKDSGAISNEVRESQERYGKLVVASVGNDGKYVTKVIPASLPGVIGVGSSDGKTARSSFSNQGPIVDVMAPGNMIVSAVGKGEAPILGQGTSYSAPTVSGCAALLLAEGYSADQVRSRILRNATDMGTAGREDSTGYGLLNCGKAFSN